MKILNLLIKNEIIPYIYDIDDLVEAWEEFQSLFNTKIL